MTTTATETAPETAPETTKPEGWDLIFCNHHPLVFELAKRVEEARAAKHAEALAGAKTNFDALLVSGVICSVDDAEDRARSWVFNRNLANVLDAPMAQIEDALATTGHADSLVHGLSRTVAEGETREEAYARIHAVLMAVPPKLRPNGKWCTHQSKAMRPGNFGPWRSRGKTFWCTRCAEVEVGAPADLKTPTEGAIAAGAQLEQIAAFYGAQVGRLAARIAQNARDLRDEAVAQFNNRPAADTVEQNVARAHRMTAETAFYRLRSELVARGEPKPKAKSA